MCRIWFCKFIYLFFVQVNVTNHNNERVLHVGLISLLHSVDNTQASATHACYKHAEQALPLCDFTTWRLGEEQYISLIFQRVYVFRLD